jgi:Domain of unknown function (DUF4129)
VTVAGLRARGTFAGARGGGNTAAAGASGAVLAIALSAAEALAVIAFIVVLASARPQKQDQDEDDEEPWRPHIPWWLKTAAVLLALAALVTPFAVLLTRKPRTLGPRRLAGAPRAALNAHASTTAASQPWPLITGMAIAIALVITLTLWSRKRRPRPENPHRTRLAVLLASLAAGREALGALGAGEPRAAIIACYAAMERGFAAAGSAPVAADTPAEVLDRATRSGLVRPEPAQALTGLFRLARYSTFPMTSADSRSAADALAEMHADLEQSKSP